MDNTSNTKKIICVLLFSLILFSGCATVSTKKEDLQQTKSIQPAPKNAYISYKSAAELIIPLDEETRYKYNSVLRGGWIQENKNLEKFLLENEQVFQEIQKGLTNDKCTLPVIDTPEKRREILYYFDRFRELTGLVLLKINYQAYKKEHKKAIETSMGLIKFGAHLEEGGNLLSKRVGMAVENTGYKILRNVMFQSNKLDYSQLSEKLQTLMNITMCRQHLKILLEEQIHQIKFNVSPLLLSEKNWSEFKESYEKSGYTQEHVVKSVENCYIDAITYSELPYYEGLKLWQLSEKPENPVRQEFLPILRNMYIECGRLEAERNATLIIIGLEHYHYKNEKYPEKLSDLIPKYLPHLPHDPFSGEPFIYQRMGKGWKIYSVGSDLKNDFAEKHSYFSEDGTGDIIFLKE